MDENEVIIDHLSGKEKDLTTIFSKIFGWMFLGLFITAATAYYVASNPALISTIFTNNLYFWGLLIAELVLVIVLSTRIHKMSKTGATVMFLAYSIVNGLTLSCIFIVYTMNSIANVFFITAGMFGIMALYGYTTKKDLTKLGSILLMGLIGIIIASIVNMFFVNDTFYLIISIIGIIIFVGLTAYDVQKIKYMASQMSADADFASKFAIIGALTLYLDFINLFLKLLSIFGKRRD